jgi:solute carrier family 66 (lysosomal lysine-arginine transporter), member 1
VPTAGTWLGNSRQSSKTPPQTNGQSEPLIGEITTAQSASPTRTKNTLSVVS